MHYNTCLQRSGATPLPSYTIEELDVFEEITPVKFEFFGEGGKGERDTGDEHEEQRPRGESLQERLCDLELQSGDIIVIQPKKVTLDHKINHNYKFIDSTYTVFGTNSSVDLFFATLADYLMQFQTRKIANPKREAREAVTNLVAHDT